MAYIYANMISDHILTKTGTYLSLKLNLVIFVNFREKMRNFIII